MGLKSSAYLLTSFQGMMPTTTTSPSKAQFLARSLAKRLSEAVHSDVLPLTDDHKVFPAIILSVVVDVMNFFFVCKWSSQDLLHDQTMLKDVAVNCSRMIRRIDTNIIVPINKTPSLPVVPSASLQHSGRRMSAQKWHGITTKVTEVTTSFLGQWGRFATTTFAQSTGDFIRRWNVLMSSAITIEMIGQIARRVIAMVGSRFDRFPATAGA